MMKQGKGKGAKILKRRNMHNKNVFTNSLPNALDNSKREKRIGMGPLM